MPEGVAEGDCCDARGGGGERVLLVWGGTKKPAKR